MNPLPAISGEDLMGVNGSRESQSDTIDAQLAISDELIDELLGTDTLVFGVPMYKFGILGALKQWIDVICRAGVSFKYSEQGPVGLLGVMRAYIIVASGEPLLAAVQILLVVI